MNKTELLQYMRYKMDVIDSDVSPSFKDTELYPFMDRAHLIIIDQEFNEGRLHFLKGLLKINSFTETLITSLSGIDGYESNSETLFPIKVDISSLTNFYLYISSSTRLSRPNDPINNIGDADTKWIPNELIELEDLDNILVTPTNRPYFLYPKVLVDYSAGDIIIYPDYYMNVDISSVDKLVVIKYLQTPKKFEDYTNTESPEIHKSLHYGIAEKAAYLAKSSINPQVTAQEIQIGEATKNSES